jgi:hypothetical protein
MAEALGWIGRNLSFGAFLLMEIYGYINPESDSMKQGLGFLAISGICEIVRYTERSTRQNEAA